MSELEAITLQMTAAFEDLRRAVAERMMPPLRVMVHEWHVIWVESLPWYRRWWHFATAHRQGLSEFVGRAEAEDPR